MPKDFLGPPMFYVPHPLFAVYGLKIVPVGEAQNRKEKKFFK